ncbi:uncharacterized protein LOC124896885 [Capsicum annuum]|uniref:uncharacterized protein LOC124896885 n=1 Tax=Capsicum annuum TaxID=4072 RepID=UPI001FB11294|nr:uncharacterized protein LOC124896885 [Capsicum annuum]
MAIDSTNKISYKDLVKGNNHNYYFSCHTGLNQEPPQDMNGQITLSTEDKQRIYWPWRFSVIIKAVGKKFNHQYLKTKLTDIWKIQESFARIDLGKELFTVKFASEEYQKRALQQGPWFTAGTYLSVRIWEPNFVPTESKIQSTVIWIRLPQMPTEFYDLGILERIAKMLGTLVKIDACTSSTLRGRYVRICVQIPPEMPLLTSILIGNNLQQIQYEGERFLCKVCGCLGHTSTTCKIQLLLPETQNEQSSENPNETEEQGGTGKTDVSMPSSEPTLELEKGQNARSTKRRERGIKENIANSESSKNRSHKPRNASPS